MRKSCKFVNLIPWSRIWVRESGLVYGSGRQFECESLQIRVWIRNTGMFTKLQNYLVMHILRKFMDICDMSWYGEQHLPQPDRVTCTFPFIFFFKLHLLTLLKLILADKKLCERRYWNYLGSAGSSTTWHFRYFGPTDASKDKSSVCPPCIGLFEQP
jgi:hypothetical protein